MDWNGDYEDREWWHWGEYTGDACPNCQRIRLMLCTDNEGKDRVICEKCDWEPVKNTYRGV